MKYTNADWNGTIDKQHSTSGLLFMLQEANIVSQLSFEFEYYTLSKAHRVEMWLCLLLKELGHISTAWTLIWVNNQDAIALAKNLKFYKRTKYIDIKFHLVQEVIKQDLLFLKFLFTQFTAADKLTKPLLPKKFERFWAMISMVWLWRS